VTVKGEWTGDASVTELSSLEVDIGKTGKWSFSPDNGTIKVLTADLPADTEPTDDQLETLEVPILATVGEGSTLTFRDSGEMTGSILVPGTGEKYAEEIEDEPIAVEMAALDDTESDTEPEAEIVKSQVNGVVDGHWNGSLYGSTGSVSKVEVASGGVWENSYKLLNDTVNASDGAEITVIDNGTLRGTVSAYGTDTLLDITVGEGGVWEVGNDLLTRTPGVAFAADDAKLTVTVNPGGTFKGDVLALNAAPAAVTSNGTWVGSAVADGTDLTVTDGGNWTGSVWAKNGGTASVTVTGTWTGMVKDPGLQTPRSYVLRQEAMARAEEAAAETQVMTLLAVSDTDSGAAATDTAIPVTLNGSGSVWNVTESGTVGSLNIDSGTVNFPTPASNDTFTGTTLTVNGDFTGNGGLFTMNTVLSNDAAATDKLIVKGNATGTAQMTFTNVGGTGAQTVDGIRVAVVEGNSDLTITKPAKNFLRAGPYIYQLKQVQNSWYLTSQKQLVFLPFTGDVDPENPSADDPSKGNTPEASDLPDIIPATPGFANHVIRPELGAYANNALASNTLFSMSLEERLGEAKYADAMRGKDGEKSGSFWIRAHGGHTRNGMEDGVLTTRGNWGVMQVGGDVISWPTSGSHRFHAGLMAGYAHESSRTTSPDAGYSAKGKVSGYSVGLYGTWMNEKSDGTGPYADVWAQWQRFKNKVSASSPDTVSYHAKGFTLSFEGGYAFGLKDWKSADGADNALRLQLQGQVIRMGVRDDGVIDAYGTSIEGLGAGNVRTRLGAKLYYQKANGEKGTAFKPFLALNWYHDTKAFGARFDGIADRIDGGRNTGEVKLGLEAKLRKNVNLWGSVGYEAGSESYRNVEALVGAKILF
jgi:autotransporter family porin